MKQTGLMFLIQSMLTWRGIGLNQILKEVGSSTKCKTKESSINLDIGNELCFDKVKVATHFNDFFTSNAASLVNKLPACSGQFGQSHVVECYRNKHVTEYMFSLANVTVGQGPYS